MRLLPLAAASFLAACQAVVGSGNTTTTNRDLSAFRTIDVASGITATVTPGARAVSIRADDNLQALIETFVQGDTLTVRVRPGTLLTSHGPLEAAIVNDVLEGMEASGGARVSGPLTPVPALRLLASGGSTIVATGASSSTVSLEASGGSHVTLAGAATSATATASGGSDLTLRELPLDALRLELSGGSRLRGRVASSLTGSASGASTATIIGTPTSSVDLSGASEVKTGAR
jgi:hypothetical protein